MQIHYKEVAYDQISRDPEANSLRTIAAKHPEKSTAFSDLISLITMSFLKLEVAICDLKWLRPQDEITIEIL